MLGRGLGRVLGFDVLVFLPLTCFHSCRAALLLFFSALYMIFSLDGPGLLIVSLFLLFKEF